MTRLETIKIAWGEPYTPETTDGYALTAVKDLQYVLGVLKEMEERLKLANQTSGHMFKRARKSELRVQELETLLDEIERRVRQDGGNSNESR